MKISTVKKMSRKVPVYTEELGIECTPNSFMKSCGACLVCMLSVAVMTSMGLIAGGTFWLAQSIAGVADGSLRIHMVQCCESDFCNGVPRCP